MRATFNSQFRDAQVSLEAASESLIDYQTQVASGKRVNKPSDDPSAASAALKQRAELEGVEQYQRTADSVSARLTVIDTSLSDIVDKLTMAQSAVSAAQGSGKSAAQRDAAARQIESVRSALIDDFNLQFNGVYVFAGTASTTRPFPVDGTGAVTGYAGSTTEVDVDISGESSVTVGFDGSAIAQGSAASDVFAVLSDLATAARSGDGTALTAGFAELQDAFTRATSAQGRVGVGMNAVDGQQTRLTQLKLAGTNRLSKLEDADLSEVITGMSHADAAYQAALGAIGAATKRSLMDYLG